MIINLLSNAIKYNRSGGNVVVQCVAVGENRVRVNVKDTGLGLSQDQLAQLFQPFNRLGKENTTQEGTGIGLVVTKQLVELMGGAIGVESIVDVGSVFWVELGACKVPELNYGSDDIVRSVTDEAEADGAPPQRTLLYVEDNPANLTLVEQLIARRSDLKLLSAINGHLGVQLARTLKPDLILMDINLPGIGGFDALRLLREEHETAGIPVIAISANAMPRDIEKGMEAGFFRYLTKPIRVNEFMSALDIALQYVDRQDSRQDSPGEVVEID